MTADDVAFLARAPNRAAVLQALAAEPLTRGDLRDRVGASRVTVGRITADLESRGWIERSESGYRATTAGREISQAYKRFVDTLETTRHLDPLLESLPTEAFDFELSALADAEVVVPTATAPDKHLDRLARLFGQSREVRLIAHAMAPRVTAANAEAAARIGQVVRGVVTPAVIESIRANPSVRERVRKTVDCGGIVLSRRPTVPFQFGVFDDVTIVSADDDVGVPRGIVVTEAPTVRQWALETFERLQAEATELGREAFAAEAAEPGTEDDS